MNYLDEYNQLKELLQDSPSPTNSTQLETFKWLHSVWLEKAEKVLGYLQELYSYKSQRYGALSLGMNYNEVEIPEELEAFPDTFKKDKQKLYKKLLSFE